LWGGTYGADLQRWEDFFEELLVAKNASGDVASQALATFTGYVLADMATRGELGRITITQVNFMLIDALDLAHQFKLHHAPIPMLTSHTSCEQRLGISVQLELRPLDFADCRISL
jgi:hypothetical protein